MEGISTILPAGPFGTIHRFPTSTDDSLANQEDSLNAALLLHPSADHMDSQTLVETMGAAWPAPLQSDASVRLTSMPMGHPGASPRSADVCIEMDAFPVVSCSSLPSVGVKTLGWLTCPVALVEENSPLPTVSVFGEPEATDELELVVHTNGEGTAQVSGQRIVSLRSQGALKPSVASFEGVAIRRAGLYVVEVRCVRQPDISLVADHPTEVVTRIDSHSPMDDVGVPEEMGLAGRVHIWGGG